ncbi:MAG TPA: hypothetical protein VME43_13295 [Bryobacteraceae bacterium]|nr:hypothetical protein [Bryobacteraceae bacterium]
MAKRLPSRARSRFSNPDARWIACLSSESGTGEIYVRPFPAKREGRWQVSSGGKHRVVRETEAFADQIGQSPAVVLGCIMAHELGHLIGLRHRPAGIMKPRFERGDIEQANMGRLRFTGQDERVLRASIGNGLTFAGAASPKEIAALGGRPARLSGQ